MVDKFTSIKIEGAYKEKIKDFNELLDVDPGEPKYSYIVP